MSKMNELYQCRDFNEIENWLKANWMFVAKSGRYYKNDMIPALPISISFQGMHWLNVASNSHSAPEGRKENWRRRDDTPKGYPGWRGTLYVTFGQEPIWYASEVLKSTKIYTGTGGGAASYRGEVTLWAEDFPNMVEHANLYPFMVPLNSAGDYDMSDERIVKLNSLMIGSSFVDKIQHPVARVSCWLNLHCGKRMRMCDGVPDTWHFFMLDDEPYVFLNTKENRDKFEEQFLAYLNNGALLKTLPRAPYTLTLDNYVKEKLGQRSYVAGCWTTDKVKFETLGEVFEFNSYKLFTSNDDFALFKIQADNIEVNAHP